MTDFRHDDLDEVDLEAGSCAAVQVIPVATHPRLRMIIAVATNGMLTTLN